MTLSQANNQDKSQNDDEQAKGEVSELPASVAADQSEESSKSGRFLAVLALLLSLVTIGAAHPCALSS